MKQFIRTYRCNNLLKITSILTVITSILLEYLHVSGAKIPVIGNLGCIVIHIAVSTVFIFNIYYHLYLHWGETKEWLKRLSKTKSKTTKLLAWLMAFVALLGFIAIFPLCIGISHTPLGAIHGKLGLLALILVGIHYFQRKRWFKRKDGKPVFNPAIDYSKCISCGLCAKKCPVDVFIKEKGSNTINVSNSTFCLQCKKCMQHCPKNAIYNKL